MLKRTFALMTILALCPFVSAAMIDGSVGPGEYANPPVVDANNEVGSDWFNSGLDIDAVYTETTATDFCFAISVEAAPFDFNGSPKSLILPWTTVVLGLYDAEDAPTALHVISVILADDGGGNAQVIAAMLDGAPLAGHSIAVGAAFEMSVPLASLNNGTGTHLRARVDDNGGQDDDQVGGLYIPEPATVGLLGLGAVALLRRRR